MLDATLSTAALNIHRVLCDLPRGLIGCPTEIDPPDSLSERTQAIYKELIIAGLVAEERLSYYTSRFTAKST